VISEVLSGCFDLFLFLFQFRRRQGIVVTVLFKQVLKCFAGPTLCTQGNRKSRTITLSIKAKEMHDEAEAVQSYRTESGASATGTSLGDLLKEQMSGNERD
jgi:hypothetical protein